MSIAYIQGDTQYGSTVLFLIGGTREEQIQMIADRMMEDNHLASWGYDEFYQKYDPDNKVNWENKEEVRKFLVWVLTEDLAVFNTDMDEIYFYISEQGEKEWYRHLQYISGGKEGIKVDYVNLDTGEKGEC